jgi:uncharacterized protein (DUF1800 family)
MAMQRKRFYILGLAGLWVPLTIGVAHGQPSTEQSNYGREARQSTPILNRDPYQPLDDREKILHVLSRFTFGATPELIAHVEKVGLKAWVTEQLESRADEPAVLAKHLAELESIEFSTEQVVQTYNRPGPSLEKKLTKSQEEEFARVQRLREVLRQRLKDSVLLRAVYSNNQLREVACDFWRNHFNVDVNKGNVRFYATSYERDVIRAQALGTFAGMLNLQARHPAMLVYLDNFVSRATPRTELADAGRRALAQSRDYVMALQAIDIARMRGLNENYARELMELHTLGVDNYYTQQDVIRVAEALTGWTVQQDPKRPIDFQFRPDMHASEGRVILKQRIAAAPQNPVQEGQAVLDLLAKHRGTAKFICYKLCRYFVSDQPSEDTVERMSKAFRRMNKTDLAATYKAILEDREFFEPANYQTKFKRPFEFVVSALRITKAEISTTAGLHGALASMNEPIYECEDPTGYYDQADAWRDPGVMAPRWQFGMGLAMGWIPGVKIPDSFWDGLEPNNPLQWKEELTRRILLTGCTEQTSRALEAVIEKYAAYNPRPDQLGRYIVGILLGSPEFQRQ